MSAAGKTQIAPHLLSTSLWGLEFCPCGAFRVLFDGTPHSRWECRNKALADPTWFTRRDRAATEGMPS